MKGIVITTSNISLVKDFGDPLYQTAGKAVDGYIEIVHPMALSKPYVMIVNDEGLLRGLPMNLTGSMLYGTPMHGSPIVGTIVIMKDGFRNGEPDIVGLDDDDIENLAKKLSLKLIDVNESNKEDGFSRE